MKKLFILTAVISMALICRAQMEIANFENLDLPVNSFWCGELDEEDEDMGFSTSWFDSGSFSFNNFYWPEYDTWSFFAYSSRTEKTFTSYKEDQFNSITGGGADDSHIFGVAFPASYMGKTVMEVYDGETPAVIPGMFVVNTAWVVDCILNGDGFEGPFETGDWLKLILTGMNGEEQTGVIEFYLADYRSDNTDLHYYLDEWTWMDLSELGDVTSVQFNIDSSKANAYGVTTPTYVCIDNVGAVNPMNGIKGLESSRLNLNFIRSSRHISVSGIEGKAGFSIHDLTGKTVKIGEKEGPNACIDINGLLGGTYIVCVTDSNSTKTIKIRL